MNETIITTQFAEDVLSGLKSKHKHLSSKYFYDSKGDELFQEIMQLEEYYLTRKELQIFESQKEQILESINDGKPFRIIELGAGDGSKTKVLLKYFTDCGIDFTYTPVDISGNVLEILETTLKLEIPNLRVESYQGDYFNALAEISVNEERDVVFFLGSTIGNFPLADSIEFLSKLGALLKPDDLLFMGVDLKKDPSIILSAYNDKKGITKEFNLNLLDRINKELEGDFDRDKFIHYPYYNPHTGECRSYLLSTVAQEVNVAGEVIHFYPWEAIFMEISKKYDTNQLQELAEESGFVKEKMFCDDDRWFADVLLRK